MRTSWNEHADRLAWDTRWTVIGGRYSDGADDLAELDDATHVRVERALSQVFVAISPPRNEPDPTVSFWSSVIRKIVQRGTRPPSGLQDPGKSSLSPSDIIGALAIATATVPDPDVDRTFDHSNERDGWSLLGDMAPHLQRWTLPQADIEALVDETTGARRADFLVAAPWNRPAVIELDGGQHKKSVANDRSRDLALAGVGIDVHRLSSTGAGDPHGMLASKIRELDSEVVRSSEAAGYLHVPAAVHRLAYAIAEAAERGFVAAGTDNWSIDLSINIPTGDRAIPAALSLLLAVDRSWNLRILPESLWLGNTLWRQSNDSYGQAISRGIPPDPSARIVIDPFVSPVAPLPDPDELPAIIIRSTHVPVDLPWTPPTTRKRLDRTRTADSDQGLRSTLKYLFGFDDFKEAQLEGISRVLSGGDALVLLPTGAGKTLIYQVAGLLRPGTTMIVAPLKSLIDDQERRLLEAGIDRTIAIHGGKELSPAEKALLHIAIGRGEPLFVIVAPERLQIEEFRRGLTEAARSHVVNLAVIDEAHCVSEWGHQFRTPYLRLGRNLRTLCANSNGEAPPILALTATAGPAVLRDLAHDLDIDLDEPGLLHRPKTFRRENLTYRIVTTAPETRQDVTRTVLAEAMEYLDKNPVSKVANGVRMGLVFTPWVNNRLGVPANANLVASTLGVDRHDIATYAGRYPDAITWVDEDDWEPFKSEEIVAFREGHKRTMVATSAFGMGIDIPNIRYSIHIAMPSSIEAFAQESGRAGRDGEPSICCLVSAPATSEEVQDLLTPDDPLRRAKYEAIIKGFVAPINRNDVSIQLWFHYQGFPDIETEVDAAMAVYDDLVASGGSGAVGASISRYGPGGADDDAATLRERGLHRLALLGIVDDYTIEHKAKKLTINVASHTIERLESSFVQYVERIRAESESARQWLIPQQSTPRDRVKHLVEGVVTLAQSTIERGRLEGIREIHRMATDDLSGDQIQDRIDSYLGAGQVASLLDRVVAQPTVSMAEVLDGLDLAPPATSEDWAGAGARYAESYPDHPVVSLVRAMGEAWRISAEQDTFNDLLARAFENMPAVHSEEYEETARWVLNQLRTVRRFGNRSNWTTDVWNIIDITGPPPHVVESLENEALDAAIADVIPINGVEVAHILARRINRINDQLRPVLAEIQLSS